MNYKELESLGLAEKEAKVYLASLELGKSSVQHIAKKSEVNRATTYVIIETLMKKGLMSSIEENKKVFYYAEPPEKLRLLFEAQEHEIVRKLDYLDKMLPELRALNSLNKNKPIVKYYEGKEGMIAMNEDFYNDKNDAKARMIFSNDLLREILSTEERNRLREKRKKTSVKVDAIINDSMGELTTNEDRRVINVPSTDYPITSDIAIYADKIRIAPQQGALSGILIENKEISNTLKVLFDMAWKYLESKEKEKEGAG